MTDSPTALRIHTVRGLLWSGVQRAGGQGIGLVVFFVLSRLLSPTAFGIIALANIYLTVVQLFVEQGVNQSVIQRKDVTPVFLNSAFSLSVGLSGVLTVLSILLAPSVAQLFHEPSLEPVLQVLSATVLLTGLRATQTAFLQRTLRFRDLAFRAALAEGLGGAVGIGMALAGLGVWCLVGQALVRAGVSVIVLWRVSDWRPRFQVSRGSLREITRFGLPILGDRLVTFAQGKADDLVVGLFLGTTALGYYSVGYRALTYLTFLVSGTMQAVSLPVLARLQTDGDRFRRVFLTLAHFLSLGSFPVFFGIAWVAPDAVLLVLGPQWGPSIPVMQVLSVVGAFRTLFLASATAFVALGRPQVQLRLNLVALVLALVGFLLLVSRGIVAIALVHLVTSLLVLPLYARTVERVVGATWKRQAHAVAAAGLGVLLMSTGLYFLGTLRMAPPPSALWLTVMITSGAGIYLATTFLAGRSSYRIARAALRDGILAGGPESAGRPGVAPLSDTHP